MSKTVGLIVKSPKAPKEPKPKAPKEPESNLNGNEKQ